MKIINTKENKFYRTADLACSAVLSLSFPIESIDRSDSHRAYFLFAQSDSIDKKLTQYQRGELRVEPRAFFDSIKAIKIRLYDQK